MNKFSFARFLHKRKVLLVCLVLFVIVYEKLRQAPSTSVMGELRQIHWEKSRYFIKEQHNIMGKNGFPSDKLENSGLFFTSSVSNVVRNIKDVRISGFKFCSILDNSLFSPWVHICIYLFLI
jgi:hypothetical protein